MSILTLSQQVTSSFGPSSCSFLVEHDSYVLHNDLVSEYPASAVYPAVQSAVSTTNDNLSVNHAYLNNFANGPLVVNFVVKSVGVRDPFLFHYLVYTINIDNDCAIDYQKFETNIVTWTTTNSI